MKPKSLALRQNSGTDEVRLSPLLLKQILKPSRPTFAQRLAAKTAFAGPSECWHWLGKPDPCSLGYGRITRDGVKLYVHRAAWEQANGPIPAGATILHTCDCPSCLNPAHLVCATQADNVADMVSKRRQRRNLTKAEVVEIDRLDTTGNWSHAKLARKFKVSETAIRRLLSGATWGGVTGRSTQPHKVTAKAKRSYDQPAAAA